jgi:hypothetical protein
MEVTVSNFKFSNFQAVEKAKIERIKYLRRYFSLKMTKTISFPFSKCKLFTSPRGGRKYPPIGGKWGANEK